MVTKPKRSSNAVIDSDEDGEEEEPEKGSDSEGSRGFDKRPPAKMNFASSSDEDDEVRKILYLTICFIQKKDCFLVPFG